MIAGNTTTAWRAQIVTRVVELRPAVLVLMRESVPDELRAGFGDRLETLAAGHQLASPTAEPAGAAR